MFSGLLKSTFVHLFSCEPPFSGEKSIPRLTSYFYWGFYSYFCCSCMKRLWFPVSVGLAVFTDTACTQHLAFQESATCAVCASNHKRKVHTASIPGLICYFC